MGKKDSKKDGKTNKVKNGGIMMAGGKIRLPNGTVVDNKVGEGSIVIYEGDLDITR